MKEVAQVVSGSISQEQIRAQYEHDSVYGSLASKTPTHSQNPLNTLKFPEIFHEIVGATTCGEKSEA